MGRPRKNPLPVVLVEGNLTVLDTVPVSPKPPAVKEPVSLKHTALSILRNPENQKWMLVSVKFDYSTKTFGEMVIIEQHSDRIEVTERFKMVSGTEFMSAV